MSFFTLKYDNGILTMIDQRIIPEEKYIDYDTLDGVIFSIKEMVVRGAPAIGVAAAYGMAIATREHGSMPTIEDMKLYKKRLDDARPTAVNLMWATERMLNYFTEESDCSYEEIINKMDNEAHRIYEEDVNSCNAISENGAALIKQGDTILTHCNAGALATSKFGTAVGVITRAHDQGKKIKVFADETRPRLQGGRLTSWELYKHGVDVTLIADSVAATLIRDGKINFIVTGADRIAANGDTANKIGTFMLSVLAKKYGVPFYIAAPFSTIDVDTPTGEEIEIEERDGDEVRVLEGHQLVLSGVKVYNPAFDVTPNEHISGIITEKGVIYPPFKENLLKMQNK